MNVKILISIIMFSCYMFSCYATLLPMFSCDATILPMDDMMDLNVQLRKAIECCNFAMVNELLAQGVNPNYKYSGHWPPLLKAAEVGDLMIVQTLLDHGANPNYKDSANWTALHEATTHYYSTIVLALLTKGAYVNASDYFGSTPLHKAAENGCEDTIDVFFMKKGADVNTQDHFGSTPLIRAVESSGPDSAKIVQKLLNKGADPDIKNLVGNTALHEAVSFNKLTMLKALLTQRSDPLITNRRGEKASDVAQDPLIRKMLTEYEADYRRQNLENLKIFLQELQKKRGYKPGDAHQALTTEASKYL